MKHLLLIRHAKSDWGNSELTDFHRPLNKRGTKDAPIMGSRLKKLEVSPQLILLSTSRRTKETMSLLIPSAKWDGIDKVEKDWLYLASSQAYLKEIENMRDELDIVCICGHNPGITEVLTFYTGELIGNMPTCSAALLSFNVEKWTHIGANSAQLVHFDYPKNEN